MGGTSIPTTFLRQSESGGRRRASSGQMAAKAVRCRRSDDEGSVDRQRRRADRGGRVPCVLVTGASGRGRVACDPRGAAGDRRRGRWSVPFRVDRQRRRAGRARGRRNDNRGGRRRSTSPGSAATSRPGRTRCARTWRQLPAEPSGGHWEFTSVECDGATVEVDAPTRPRRSRSSQAPRRPAS